MVKYWIKQNIFENIIFPQFLNFCGVASCCTVCNSLTGSNFTQVDLHHKYGIGYLSKFKIPYKFDFSDASFENRKPSGMGISNWDIIKLFNSVMLDNGMTPYSLLLTGNDLKVELSEGNYSNIRNWLLSNRNQIIIHLVGHYVVYAGSFSFDESEFIICGDSSKSKGPVNSISLAKLVELCSLDDEYSRYGFIFCRQMKSHINNYLAT